MDSRLTIFVDSFDGYSDMWDIYFLIFDHYWPDCKYKKVLVTNELTPKFNNVNVINTGKEINWMDRTIRALNLVETEYVLFSLEDYFIGKKVKNYEIDDILDFMSKNKINCYKLYPWPKSNTKFRDGKFKHLHGYKKNDAYAINGALSIFKTDFLIKILKKCVDAETCFDFEYYYLNNKENVNDTIDFSSICYDDRDILGYHNGIIRGKWLWSTVKYYKKQGLNIDFSNREKMSFSQTFFYLLRFNMPQTIKKILRKTIKQSNLGLK